MLEKLIAEILCEYIKNPNNLEKLKEEPGIFILKNNATGITIHFSKI